MRLILLGVLLTTALTSDAQYRKLTRGQPMPYDTGVAVEISRYRVEGLYIKKSKATIDSLNLEAKILTQEVDSLYAEIAVADSLYRTEAAKTVILSDSYKKLSEDTHRISELFDQMANKKKPWYEVALRYLVIGLAGYGGASLIF